MEGRAGVSRRAPRDHRVTSWYDPDSGEFLLPKHYHHRPRETGMSHERTIEQLAREIEHLTGTKIRIGWIPFYGIYLEDTETGNRYSLGKRHKREIRTSAEQESICHNLRREHWNVLLGLNPPQD
jgi:hypothetical protein